MLKLNNLIIACNKKNCQVWRITHTETHELGNAAGLEHVSNPKILMYYKCNGIEAKPEEEENIFENTRKKMRFIYLMLPLIFGGCIKSNTCSENSDIILLNEEWISPKKIENYSKNCYSNYILDFNSTKIKRTDTLVLFFFGKFRNDKLDIFFNNELFFQDILNIDSTTEISGYYVFKVPKRIKTFSIKINDCQRITLDYDSINYALKIHLIEDTIRISNVEKYNSPR